MQIPLTEDQTLIRDSVGRFGAEFGGADRLRELRDAGDGYDTKAMAEAGAGGWLGLVVPEDSGGAGLGATELCLVAEELGQALTTLPVVPAAAGVLALARGRANGLLAAALAGEALVVPAFQGDILDRDEARLSVAADGDGTFRLSGSLVAVPGAAAAAAFIVDAGHGDDQTLFVVAREAGGLGVNGKRATDGSQLGSLEFDNVTLDHTSVLARGAEAASLRQLLDTLLQLGLAAELLGLMDKAHAIAMDYMRTREQFGRPIAKFQALQHKAVDNYLRVETARSLLYETARLADREDGDASWLASAAKAFIGEAALTVTKTTIQLHGAIGFTDELDIGLYLKRAMTVANTCGPVAAHRRRYREASMGAGNAPRAELPSFREDSDDEAAFRLEVREWLEANLPDDLRNIPTRPTVEKAMWWHRQMHARGWAAPDWPREWGGMEATLGEQVIFADELARIGSPEISAQALHHVGPILIRFGNDEQKARHLPGMLSGEVLWCQGYSEPNAGSDLASLRTSAVIDGDELVINGQKIWTTWGQYADWMFALVRTDPDAPKKQMGITFVLIDMKTPGITRRGIMTLPDEDEFAEVFFDDVRVPVSNVVGEINDGWTVATALLANERTGSANPMRSVMALREIRTAAAASGAMEDVAFQEKLVDAELTILALTAAFSQVVTLTENGQSLGAQSSFVKLVGTESIQRLADVLMDACGSDGALWHDGADAAFNASPFYLRARRATIAAGTSEIQRNIIAKRVLDLG